jgi:hypothetical protein
MALDVRTAQTALENAVHDAILYAFGHRLPAAATVAALRALTTRGASSSQRGPDDLINVESGGAVVRAYRWTPLSGAADNGTTVIKPDDVSGNGRWVAWTSPLRIARTVGGDSAALHELKSGSIRRVIVLDRDVDKDEMTNLLTGESPAVAIEAKGDVPEDLTQDSGYKWDARYDFTVYCVAENLRGDREAAQGSAVTGDTDPGANDVDGLIWALLGGTQLYSVLDGIRNVQVGRGDNWVSDLAQRRVIRSREYTVLATVEYPAAPNDAGPLESMYVQEQAAALGEQTSADVANHIASGLTVSLGVGLSKSIAAGTAYIAGQLVTYVGELHTFGASVDTYRDLNPDGTFSFVEAPLDAEEPDVTLGALRIGVTRTDGSSVTDDRFIASSAIDFGPDILVTPLS